MTDEYGISKDVDDDYIDVEKRRANVSTDGAVDKDDEIARDRSAVGRESDETDVHGRNTDMSYAFGGYEGDGSASAVDEQIDQNAVIEHDGRASTRTFFYPEEADDAHVERFQRLIQWQEDKWSGMKNAQRAADRMRTIGNFCGTLDMSPHQQRRVECIVDGINMSHMAHYSSQKVIIAVVSLVANEDGRFIRDEGAFRDLLVDVGSDLDEVKNVRSLIRDKSERL